MLYPFCTYLTIGGIFISLLSYFHKQHFGLQALIHCTIILNCKHYICKALYSQWHSQKRCSNKKISQIIGLNCKLRITGLGLPWWRSGWESACQCRGHRFEPWSGKIPHAAEQLGPWATTTEPVRLEPVLRNKRGRDSERPAHHDEEWPPFATTRKSPHTETKTQHSHKLIN